MTQLIPSILITLLTNPSTIIHPSIHYREVCTTNQILIRVLTIFFRQAIDLMTQLIPSILITLLTNPSTIIHPSIHYREVCTTNQILIRVLTTFFCQAIDLMTQLIPSILITLLTNPSTITQLSLCYSWDMDTLIYAKSHTNEGSNPFCVGPALCDWCLTWAVCIIDTCFRTGVQNWGT
jgi:hypothetical protein